MMLVWTFLFVAVAATTSTAVDTTRQGNNARLRGGDSSNSGVPRRRTKTTTMATSTPSILCRLTMFDTLYVTNKSESSTTEQTTCIPIVDGIETDMDFAIDLPTVFVEQYVAEIETGKLLVKVSNASIVDDALVMGSNPTYTVLNTHPGQQRQLQDRHLQTSGVVTIAMIRISTLDAAPTVTASDWQGKLFGTGTGSSTVNFAAQYEACSFGKLKMQLVGNVIDLQLPNRVTDFASSADLVTATQKLFKAQNGGKEVSKLANKVVMCLPPGTGDWAASAGVNHWRAQFNNDWCTSLSGIVHELGHTMGLLHANAGGVDYADRSGYMGSGYTDQTWPRKCFNGYNSWRFGWYDSRHTLVNPSIDGNKLIALATFVDFAATTVDESVVINIADQYYLLYNKAKGFNVDTEHKANQVTITQPTGVGTNSLAGLSAEQRYSVTNFNGSGQTLIVEACRQRVGSGGSDVMDISIGLDVSLCASSSSSTGAAMVSSPRPPAPTPPTGAAVASPMPATAPVPSPTASPTATTGKITILEWLRNVLANLRKKSAIK